MSLVIEARHAVVGLRFEIGADDATFGVGGEERQTPACDEVTDQRRYEDGLAGARKTRHAEAYRWRQVVREASLRIFEKIGISGVSQVMPRMSQEKGAGEPPLSGVTCLSRQGALIAPGQSEATYP